MNKKLPLLLGLFCLSLAWAGYLPSLAGKAFFGHMIMHMLVVAIAAPLIALGLTRDHDRYTFRFPLLIAPIPAAVAELIIVWAWHAPVLHHFARHSLMGLVLEQSSFLLAGVWVWFSSFSNKGAGVIGLLLTSMHMTFLGALLGLSTRSLYSHNEGFSSLTALEDQHLGGAIMLIVGGISYLSGGLWLTSKILRERHHEKLV